MIYFLCPKVSEINEDIWDEFYKGAYEVLKNFKPHGVLDICNLRPSFLERVSSKDLLIFFNPPKEIEICELNKILKESKDKGMKIFPISTSKSNRCPPEIIADKQSFDIITEKKLRGLSDNYIRMIGECFGREVIITYFPALFDEKINFFLSHRRKEFEEIASLFKKFLHGKREYVFIDLEEVTVGEDAQEKIEEKLREDTDIMIFIQTKTTFESEFQLKELKEAFHNSIPILWVTLGLEKGKEFKKLKLHPVGKPHFELDEINEVEINKIIHYAFNMIKLRKQRLLDDVVYQFKTLKDLGIEYKEICECDNIYHIKVKLKDIILGSIKIQERIFKCLCRKYKEEDKENLKVYIESCHKDNCIISINTESKEIEEGISLKNYDEFFDNIISKELQGGIIISGSFPDNIGLMHQQNIVDALYCLVKDILKRNGKVIFGSHPTFQGVILERAKKFNCGNKEKIKLYVSKQFEGNYDIEYFKENSEVFEIEKDSFNKISDSLTKMREAMVNDKDAIALICIGGKEKSDSLTNKPGIDEEIELAKKRGIPVFVLGSTGGRSKEYIEEGFKNPLINKKEKEEVDSGNNFKHISKIILDMLSQN